MQKPDRLNEKIRSTPACSCLFFCVLRKTMRCFRQPREELVLTHAAVLLKVRSDLQLEGVSPTALSSVRLSHVSARLQHPAVSDI